MGSPCHNRLTIFGETELSIKAFLSVVQGPDDEFDFDKILPMPSCLSNVFWGGLIFDNGKPKLFKNNPFGTPRCRPLTEDEIRAVEKTGYVSEYEWKHDHWGGIIYQGEPEVRADTNIVEIEFYTERSPAIAIVEALRGKFPHLQITAFYDQQYWQETGYY
ncbi:hypothetical protein [Celeribacter sp. PS-C1]|uniref:hypothetical protein n=1 Tax=Celeribacter sp. PS-C1 TaxID=2820813 RepID=UPI001CA4EA5E|nr:hypothetical protein [Celeribacter sp. PS-C1]MBW6419637.1 hypothetical protein [Celeribacter sp. PS-C1]